jgi:hypothetical protein
MSSGLPSKADIALCSRHVSKVPYWDIRSLDVVNCLLVDGGSKRQLSPTAQRLCDALNCLGTIQVGRGQFGEHLPNLLVALADVFVQVIHKHDGLPANLRRGAATKRYWEDLMATYDPPPPMWKRSVASVLDFVLALLGFGYVVSKIAECCDRSTLEVTPRGHSRHCHGLVICRALHLDRRGCGQSVRASVWLPHVYWAGARSRFG